MQPARSNSRIWKGIALMVTAMACFAAMNVAVRALSFGMASTQMVFLRNAISLFFIALWVIARRSPLRTTRLSGHAWRSGLGFLAMETWFYALSLIPLTLATALSFTTPVFQTAFAILFLGEKAGWRRMCAIAVSMAGVLIILRPDAGAVNFTAGFVLLSSGLMALSGTLVKSLTRTEKPETIVFYMALIMTPLSLPPALLHWDGDITPRQWGLLALIALFSTGAHLLVARAYAYAELVVLLPFDFTRLIFTGALAWLIFGERIDAATLAGAAIIMASAVYITHREALRRAKDHKKHVLNDATLTPPGT